MPTEPVTLIFGLPDSDHVTISVVSDTGRDDDSRSESDGLVSTVKVSVGGLRGAVSTHLQPHDLRDFRLALQWIQQSRHDKAWLESQDEWVDLRLSRDDGSLEMSGTIATESDRSTRLTFVLHGIDEADLASAVERLLHLEALLPEGTRASLGIDTPPPAWPAGTASRPPLPLEQLPSGLWRQLQERQDRLPLAHLRRPSDWAAISINEQRAVMKVADRDGLDDDERYSLLHYHLDEVRRRGAEARPDLVPPPVHSKVELERLLEGPYRSRRPTYPWLPPALNNWVCWIGNRRDDLKAAWFRFRFQ